MEDAHACILDLQSLSNKGEATPAAQETLAKVLKDVILSPSRDHPAAVMCAETALRMLKKCAERVIFWSYYMEPQRDDGEKYGEDDGENDVEDDSEAALGGSSLEPPATAD
ncbi:hypothetical protein BCR34DRAFT_606710 [Clohesyomyces aquaticus]|uniref:Uncharacterized protein n=1 Tax=Clohesyomyces aquaticus TaxID=1231657 RepID=A0A1Y1YNI4_9PLEO|nr:hypothetical protein BCR34DRAFT_606710 [Clohesyomyces aquaticus]